MSNALYRFTAKEDGSGYTVSGKTTDGIRVYLGLRGGKAGYPQITDVNSAGSITLEENGDGSFRIRSSGSYNGYLYFWRDANKLYFDQQSSADSTLAATKFLLYRPVGEADTSSAEIPGYVKVTDGDAVQDGGYYLIVAEMDGSYYALYPSGSTGSKYAHVIKVDPDSAIVTKRVGDITYTLSITGVGVGTTDVMAGGIVYRVTVTDPVIPVTSVALNQTSLALKINETVALTATVEPDNATSQTGIWSSSDESVATVDENGNVTAVSAGSASITVEVGGQTATCAITVSQVSYGSGTLGMDATYSGQEVPLGNALYTFTSNGSGYTVSNSFFYGELVYLCLRSGKSGCPQTNIAASITLTENEDGSFYIKSSTSDYTGYLYFRHESSKVHFDQTTTITDGNKLFLYRPVKEGEASSNEVPGYVKVIGVDSVHDGGQYLIVAQVGDTCFALYPSTSNGYKYAHVVKVNS